MYNYIYIYLLLYYTFNIYKYICIQELFKFSTSVYPLLKATFKHHVPRPTKNVFHRHFHVSSWPSISEAKRAATEPYVPQGSKPVQMTIKRHVPDENLRKISVSFGLDFPWMFRPPSRSSDVFFILGTTKSRKFVLQVAKSFREKHSLWPWRVLNSVFQDSRLKSWLDLGEKMRRSDAWKGGYSIYKSGALQRCFYGSYMT